MCQKDRRFVGVVIEKGFEGGGIGRSMGYVVEAWQGEGKAPEVKAFDTRGKGSVVWSPFFLLWELVRITCYALSRRLVLLHVNLASGASALRNLFVIALACFLRIPVVTHLHGGGFAVFYGGLSPLFKRAVKWMFKKSSRVIVLGKRWFDLLADQIGVAPEKIVIVPNGVPRPSLTKGGSEKRSGTPCNILFLGLLCAEKGVSDLLSALALPSVKNLPWKAVLAGNGSIAFYENEGLQLGLSGRVDFPGWVGRSEAERLLSEADILVLPSYIEGLPMVVLEALAYGLPVIATPVGSIPELLTDGQTALLVPPGNVQKLGEAIERLMTDAALRQKLSAQGRALFDKEADVRLAAMRIKAIYESVLSAT